MVENKVRIRKLIFIWISTWLRTLITWKESWITNHSLLFVLFSSSKYSHTLLTLRHMKMCTSNHCKTLSYCSKAHNVWEMSTMISNHKINKETKHLVSMATYQSTQLKDKFFNKRQKLTKNKKKINSLKHWEINRMSISKGKLICLRICMKILLLIRIWKNISTRWIRSYRVRSMGIHLIKAEYKIILLQANQTSKATNSMVLVAMDTTTTASKTQTTNSPWTH